MRVIVCAKPPPPAKLGQWCTLLLCELRIMYLIFSVFSMIKYIDWKKYGFVKRACPNPQTTTRSLGPAPSRSLSPMLDMPTCSTPCPFFSRLGRLESHRWYQQAAETGPGNQPLRQTEEGPPEPGWGGGEAEAACPGRREGKARCALQGESRRSDQWTVNRCFLRLPLRSSSLLAGCPPHQPGC